MYLMVSSLFVVTLGLFIYVGVRIYTGTFGLWGGGGGGAVTFLTEKLTQCPNARLLRSGCKRTETA